jgi:hypothetical protein
MVYKAPEIISGHRKIMMLALHYLLLVIPVQAWTGREGSRRLRVTDSMTVGT